MKKSVKQSLSMGLLCLPFGVMGGLVFGLRPGSSQDLDVSEIAFALVAAVSSLVSGMLTWFLMVIRRRHLKVWRGMLAGAVAVIFAHWLTLELMLIASNLSRVVGKGDPHRMFSIFELTFGNIGLTVLSLLVVGWWLTIPIGSILGGLLILLQRRALSRVPDTPA
ncbi:hypothetical protein [Paraburkholderia dinghuensis]|uniref:Uncharacterized protein n=1 Tax=Paraburkholderia dinghuensis TaxID=2305225 RepID=A0A3N6PU69_9BURK|nr:hypothetical protein [Paraburkholderia dinghuensis]RQH05650.1 hypothetical protein D1Y85_13520 [Paraburkholderia dinghuensis]